MVRFISVTFDTSNKASSYIDDIWYKPGGFSLSGEPFVEIIIS